MKNIENDLKTWKVMLFLSKPFEICQFLIFVENGSESVILVTNIALAAVVGCLWFGALGLYLGAQVLEVVSTKNSCGVMANVTSGTRRVKRGFVNKQSVAHQTERNT